MYTALTLLKVVVIIVGMIFLTKKIFMSKTENKLWAFFKIVAIVFSVLMLITVMEFAIAGVI
ncbi:MAG: hypothetical protein JWQ66_2440 [Mucilaginibacter sp.]|nr:hypothetical protein [Mucilaginibacter sp.]